MKTVKYKTKATGTVVEFELGSRAEMRCRDDPKNYECLTAPKKPEEPESKPEKPDTKKPEKSG
jgi:hypothetical protein